MNEDLLNDLKQFIDSRISQSEALTDKKFGELGSKVGDIEAKVDTIAEALSEQLNGHETRLSNLEQQTA